MYQVIKLFTDLQDNEHEYKPGDTFPRKGLKVTQERIEELAGHKNKQRVPLIEEVVTAPKGPKDEELKTDKKKGTKNASK